MIAQDRPDGTEACPDNLNVEPFLAAAQLNSTAGRRRMARHPPRPTLPADAASVAGFFDRRRVVALTRRAAAIAAKHREKARRPWLVDRRGQSADGRRPATGRRRPGRVMGGAASLL
jgi:hypothetical protein